MLPESNATIDDEVSLKEIILKIRDWFSYLISKWPIITTVCILGGGIGLFYVLSKKPVYTAECTFVLEEGETGGFSNYSGIASMVGIDIGGGGSNGIFQGENIFELYKSRLMIEKTLLSEALFNGKGELLIDRYIKQNNLRDKWSNNPKLQSISFADPQKFTLAHDSIIGAIVNDISKNYLSVGKPDKKLSIISVKIKSGDELFAKNFTDKIVENVNQFYVQTKTKKSFENVQLLQKQADSVRRVLNSSIGGSAAAIDANPNANPALQVLRVPSQRRQVDIQASSAIYAEVVKNLEISKISYRKETPLIQVIDRPKLPLTKITASKSAGFLAGFLIAFFITTLVLIIRRVIILST